MMNFLILDLPVNDFFLLQAGSLLLYIGFKYFFFSLIDLNLSFYCVRYITQIYCYNEIFFVIYGHDTFLTDTLHPCYKLFYMFYSNSELNLY